MKTLIQFYVRSVYGVERAYIVGEEQAKAICALTRRKTVEKSDLHALAALGCEVQQVPDPKAFFPSGLPKDFYPAGR